MCSAIPHPFPRLASRLLALVLIAALLVPAGRALAAPPAQEGEAESLILGQFVYEPVRADEVRVYELNIPESGDYQIIPVNEESANFDLIVIDAEGNELFNDIFEGPTVPVTLESGKVTLEFYAVEDSVLFFVVLGEIGVMSADPDRPGVLNTGSIYYEDRISEGRYATLTIPDTTYPQQVLIYLATGEGDTFFVSAEGPGVGYAAVTTEEKEFLRFWTDGGEYLISVEPYERRSELALTVYLSGRPDSIAIGDSIQDTVPAGATEAVYELELDATYDNLVLELESDAELGLVLVDTIYNSDVRYESYGESTLEIPNLYPGVYYVFVTAPEEAAEAIPFSLSVSGAAGRPIVALEDGVPHADAFEGGEESIGYTFEVSQPGALVTVALSSEEDDTNFDIGAGLRPGISLWASYTYGSNDELTFMAPVAGVYHISIIGYGDVGEFEVTASEGDLAPELVSGQTNWGTIPGSGSNVYRLEVDETGMLLVMVLVGSDIVDLDLHVTAYNEEGDTVAYLSGATGGSMETVSQVLTEPGVYEVVVTSYFGEGDTAYFLTSILADPTLLGGQWATDAVASSEYGEEGWSALQAAGPQDTFAAGDYTTAWASAEPDGGEETLELFFDFPVVPTAVEIYESYNPGAVIAVDAYNIDTGEWVTLWEGEAAPAEEAYRIFSPELAEADFRTDQIRLVLDTAAVPGYNEIDAVQLFGRP